MPSAGPGITSKQVAKKSLLNRHVDLFVQPRAADVDFVVDEFDPSGVTVGAALTLLAAVSGKRFRLPRKVTITAIDASGGGGGLSCTVTVSGQRFGEVVTENVTVTCTDGNATTATSSKVFDQVLSATLKDKTNAASGDSLAVGIDGTTLGLPRRISRVADVKSIVNVASGTEAAPVTIDSTSVDVANSAIKGLTVAATDIYQIEYDAAGADGIGSLGVEA